MVALRSLASALNPVHNEKRADALLLTLDDQDDTPIGDFLRFQYFPDSLNDQKQVNYNPKEIPGATLPLYQWMSTGERLITFTAVFTTDIDLTITASGQPGQQVNTARLAALANIGAIDRNVDIRAAIVWLRRHILPRYGPEGSVGTTTVFAPRKVKLYLPNSGIGLYGGQASSTARDSIIAFMTLCDVTFEAFFPSGLPRIVAVNMAFAQSAQYQGQVHFPSATDALDGAVRFAPTPRSQPLTPVDFGLAPYSLGARSKILDPTT
jgi:hypothetical protein